MSDRHSYAGGPCHPELAAIALIGLTHIVLETTVSEAVALWFSGVAALVFVGYLLWRARGGAPVLRAWGVRRDNFWVALGAQLPIVVGGGVAILGYGLAVGSLGLPRGFWLTLALYPVWGIAQQFGLQNLIGRNVASLVSHPVAVAGVAAALFAASLMPRWPLVFLTLVSGFFFTLFYRRAPNLWAVGIVHGVLGSLAIYLVSQEDPGASIWQFLAGP